jgi:DNA modification methylase
MNFKIYNDDCFNIFSKIENKSINLFLLDLPYGQTACKWDSLIDLDKMWKEIKRTMKSNAIIIFFCTTKFGVKLINSNPKWFRYDLIWEKSRKVSFLSANRKPLVKHEMIYIFSDACNDDIEITRNKELREYAKKVLKYIGKSMKTIEKEFGNRQVEHFFYINSSQFGIPIKKNYEKLTKLYNLDKMEGYLNYDVLESKWEAEPQSTYNPQKTEGKPYKTGDVNNKDNVYGITKKGKIVEGRHPSTILKYNNPVKSLHRTQKPTDLLEWLIKSYSNENDIICDFTMGSASTGIACLNTKRQFIGIEKDKDIFKIAEKRLKEHQEFIL